MATAISSSTGKKCSEVATSLFAFEVAVHQRCEAIAIATSAFVDESLQSCKIEKKCRKMQKIACLALLARFVPVPMHLVAVPSPCILWLIADLKNIEPAVPISIP